MKRTCYACDKLATSKEHVPPKCFFPKKKYLLSGMDYRRNLIRVASCDDHNQAKSQDDLYLLFVILSHYGNSATAQRYFSRKIIPLLKRYPSLLRKFIPGYYPATVHGQATGAIVLDIVRVRKCLDLIARAIYFRHYEEKWHQPQVIICPAIIEIDGARSQEFNRVVQYIDLVTAKLFSNAQRQGQNPGIFYYQIHRETQPGSQAGDKMFTLRLVFYERFVAVVHSPPSCPVDGITGP